MYGNISGIWDHRYAPEDIYYNHIEPRLNNKFFSKAYTDKNYYTAFLGGFGLPETIICNRDGIFYDNKERVIQPGDIIPVLCREDSLIIKPAVDSGGGKGVSLWRRSGDSHLSAEGDPLTVTLLNNLYGRNFTIQRLINQHPFYSAFNRSSVNTVRMLTYRSVTDERIHIIQTVLRVGATGSITDNQASGGYACGVTADGKITGKAVDKKGHIYTGINSVSLIAGTELVSFAEMKEAAVAIASQFHYSRLLGLDLCLDTEGKVRLIEVNNVNNEINFYQMLNGPLFGEFTGEIVNWCINERRTFLIDFTV